MRSILLILLCLIFACAPESENPKEMDLSILLLGNPQCKGVKSAEIYTTGSQSCVDYTFDQKTQKLRLKHINTGFNCCPESLWCTVIYRNDTIIVREFEKNMGCKCNCLYDLDIMIDGVEPGDYQLQMIEPYLGTQQPLIFELDLKNCKEGSSCVPRTNYPW